MEETLDAKIQELAEQTIEKHVASGTTKLLLTFAVSVGLWWLRRELSKKEKELADARLKMDTDRLNAEKAAHEATEAKLESEKAALLASVEAHKQQIAASEARLRAHEELHQKRLKEIQAIEENDWIALNKLAGVTP